MAGRVLVLAYHNLVPDEDPAGGDRSLHLPLSSFVWQLEHLRRTVDVVPLTEALTPSHSARPRAVITFDDAYRGATLLGSAALADAGLPATYFVAPELLGGTPWWDRFAPEDGEWSAELRERLLRERAGRDREVAAWATEAGIATGSLGDWHRIANEEELARAASRPGMTVGSHSWGHPNLCALAPDELRDELARPAEWLDARFPTTVPWLAYPYGLVTPEVARAVAAQGFAGALRVDGGWWPRALDEPFDLPRWNVPAGISRAGFRLRLAGWLCR
ncbi:MAG: polysaccharide deacetylase family protein [Gemmatimonadales bacterium]